MSTSKSRPNTGKKKRVWIVFPMLLCLVAITIITFFQPDKEGWEEEPRDTEKLLSEASEEALTGEEVEKIVFETAEETRKTEYDAGEAGSVSVCISVSMEEGYSHTEIDVASSLSGAVQWEIYWAHSDTGRLEAYKALYVEESSGEGHFIVTLNDGLYMPTSANGVEIVFSGAEEHSFFAAVPELLYAPESERLYSFFVLSDMHVNQEILQYETNLTRALEDVQALDKDSLAIMTVGDNTDNGKPWEYDLLMNIVQNAGEDLPPVYYALGNHDLLNNFDRRRKRVEETETVSYGQQEQLFLEKTGMSATYYSLEMNGTKFITLASEELFREETSAEQLAWLEAELNSADAGAPIFIFLHEPLPDTVSGSLSWLDAEIQDWYGAYEQVEEIRALLAEYPNALLFTGHTHWELESIQPVLMGLGKDATFVNCASTAYLWTDTDEERAGSQGWYVEVFEDYILLRGRDFSEEKWCAVAQFLIPCGKA